MKTGARAAEYENAIQWLVTAHLMYQVYRAEQISFIQTVSPTDTQSIVRWDLSVIADVSVDGSIHHIACFKFYDKEESYVGNVWTDLDDQHRIVQMVLVSTALV